MAARTRGQARPLLASLLPPVPAVRARPPAKAKAKTTRTTSRTTKRSAEIEKWSMPVSPELLELAKLHDGGKLPAAHGELRPFHFDDPFFLPPRGAPDLDPYLLQAQELGWPVYWLAHFAGLHPIGATRGGDYWLARVAPKSGSEASRVYLYDHETGELKLAFRSLADLVRGAPGFSAFDFQQPAAPKLSPSDDPIALWERASWAADFIGAGALESWTKSIDGAATFATFEKEAKDAKRLGERPDLVAYWLLAHALLGNAAAVEAVDRVAAKIKNPFVIALRSRAKSLVGASELKALTLRKLSAVEVVQRLEQLRRTAPKTLRRGTPPPLPQTGPQLTLEMVTALAKEGQLLQLVAEHPARETLHLWALENIKLWAKHDRGPVAALERIADVGLTKKRLKEMATWISMSPLVADSGQREAELLEMLAERKSKRATEIVLRTLAILEKTWTRIELAARTALLATKLDGKKARPILERMVNDKTWKLYETEAMPRFRKALKSIDANA